MKEMRVSDADVGRAAAAAVFAQSLNASRELLSCYASEEARWILRRAHDLSVWPWQKVGLQKGLALIEGDIPSALAANTPPDSRRILLVAGQTTADDLHENAFDDLVVCQMEDILERRAGFASEETKEFDCVICDDGAWRDHSLRLCLAEIRTFVRPGGSLVACLPNPRHYSAIGDLIRGSAASRLQPAIVSTSRTQFERMSEEAGWIVRDAQLIENMEMREWRAAGMEFHFSVGPLAGGALAKDEAIELFARYYITVAERPAALSFGLTSIILLTHNNDSTIRESISAIRRHTYEPYELIIVDDGSIDGTAEYICSLADVQVVAMSSETGLAGRVNSGVHAARGEQIVLLRGDVLVTADWLPRLLAAAGSGADIGVVAPCWCGGDGPQSVAWGPQSIDRLGEFSRRWAREHADQVVPVQFVDEPCMLIRRAVLDRTGGWRSFERVNRYEGIDFCRRAVEAGFRIAVARDVYMHLMPWKVASPPAPSAEAVAYGKAVLAGVDSQLRSSPGAVPPNESETDVNSQRDRECSLGISGQPTLVGLANSCGERISAARGTPPTSELSLCMIVRDNAGTLDACLKGIVPWVDEIVVVDTGSSDETPLIAERYGAKVFRFPWCDDFAAARNESLRHATSEWLFWMDSDDTIDEANGQKLRALARRTISPATMGFVMQVHCPGIDADNDVTVVDHVKMVRNIPELRFEGRIHEQLLPSIRRLGGDVEWTDIFVTHSGSDRSSEGRRKKLERDLRLLELDAVDRPDHPFVLFNLGMTLADAGRHKEAVDSLVRCLAKSAPSESHVRKAYALLVASYSALGRYDEASRVCEEGLRAYLDDPELTFRKGIIAQNWGRLEEAECAYRTCLSYNSASHRCFRSVDSGITGFKARHNLAVVYGEMSQFDCAEHEWRAILAERPTYRAAFRGLLDALSRQNRLEEARSHAEQGLLHGTLRAEGLLWQARMTKERGDLAAARQAYRSIAREFPDDEASLRETAEFLFWNGDPAEAEGVLGLLTDLCPDDPSAHFNLGTVCARRGDFERAAAEFRESLSLRPSWPATLNQLAFVLDKLGRHSEAAATRLEAKVQQVRKNGAIG